MDYDPNVLKDIRTHALEIKSIYGDRDIQCTEMENMYLLNDPNKEDMTKGRKHVKYTISPDARNTLLGAVRLLIATDPAFSIPHDANDAAAQKQSEPMEKWTQETFVKSSRVYGRPWHYDVVLSMALFAEVNIAITRTADLVANAQGGSKAAIAKAEEIAAITPYVFDVWHPMTCYPEFTNYGLTSFYREVSTTTGAVRDEFGADATQNISGKTRNEPITLCQWWDYEWRAAWLFGSDDPLLMEQHGLSFIPIVSAIGEGSKLFADPSKQRQPFYYSLWKSGLHDRETLALTSVYTNVFFQVSNPMTLYKANVPGKELKQDFSVLGGLTVIDKDEDLGPYRREPIDPAMLEALRIAEQKSAESTIFGQTLGEPLGGGNAPYSAVALMHQAGRLPLLVTQRTSQSAIAEAMRIALSWFRDEGYGGASYKGAFDKLKPSDVPKHFELDCKLDVNLPQDKMQMANVARAISSGEDPLTSVRWTRENILNVGQSDAMQAEIWGEKAANLKAMQYFSEQMLAIKQQMQEAMAPPQPPMPQGPPQGMPPGGIEQTQTPPPEFGQPNVATPGMPMQGPQMPPGMPPQGPEEMMV